MLARDLLALTKPHIALMSVLVATAGMSLAPLSPSLAAILDTLAGIGLLVAGAGCLNMLLERNLDLKMQRTCKRPLPSGRIKPSTALLFGAGLSALALGLLWHGANPLTGLLGTLGLGTYVLVYTPVSGHGSWLYASFALTAGLGLLAVALLGAWLAASSWARRYFRASLAYLPLLALGMMLDRWLLG